MNRVLTVIALTATSLALMFTVLLPMSLKTAPFLVQEESPRVRITCFNPDGRVCITVVGPRSIVFHMKDWNLWINGTSVSFTADLPDGKLLTPGTTLELNFRRISGSYFSIDVLGPRGCEAHAIYSP